MKVLEIRWQTRNEIKFLNIFGRLSTLYILKNDSDVLGAL